MRKKVGLMLIIIVNTIIAILIGWYMYRINNISENEAQQLAQKPIIKIEDECTEFAKFESIQTNANNEKISPNANLIVQKYYKDCFHTTKDYVELPKELVNMTEDELKEYYGNWTVKEFSKDTITLYKEFNGICNQHYVLREKDGYVAIFTIDEEDIEHYIKSTGIAIQYLSEKDLENLKDGIKVFGNDRLQQALEDFE